MKKIAVLSLTILFLSLTSCFEDLDDNPAYSAVEVNDFIWKALNFVYLYKDDVPDLADNRFSSSEEYSNYLNGFAEPRALFESLMYQRQTVDRFSFLTPDYIALEQQLNGTSVSNGMEFQLYYEPNSEYDIVGVITVILNNSNASNQDLQRGQFFTAIDGIELNKDNYNDLLSQENYTISLGEYNDNGTPNDNADDSVSTTTETVALSKTPYTENPVHTTNVIDVNGEKLGYLHYTSFTNEFDSELNSAFAQFQAENVQHLVLDLRYNGGGSVRTASYLGSMITGGFTGDVFSELQYNSNLQEFDSDYTFANAMNSGETINSLNLDKIYVLTTESSASASEMMINSLKPYIDVVQVGETTTGKSQASIMIYDSPGLTDKDGINPNHKYAMLPLVAISVNVNDGQVPTTGLVPDIELSENVANLGVLGNENELFLAAVIADITGTSRLAQPTKRSKPIKTDFDQDKLEGLMFVD